MASAATAWDIATFQSYGRKAVIAYAGIVFELASRGLDAAKECEAPRDWSVLVDKLTVFAKMIPQELVTALVNADERDNWTDGLLDIPAEAADLPTNPCANGCANGLAIDQS